MNRVALSRVGIHQNPILPFLAVIRCNKFLARPIAHMIGSVSHEISHYIPRNHPISSFPPCVFAPYQGQQLPFEIFQKLPIRLRKATANLIDGTNTPEVTRHRPGNQPYMFINVKEMEMGYEILCKKELIKHLKYLEMPIIEVIDAIHQSPGGSGLFRPTSQNLRENSPCLPSKTLPVQVMLVKQ